MKNILVKTALFANISESDLNKLLVCLQGRTLNYKKGEFIFVAGHTTPFVGIILSGTANIIKENLYADRMIISKLSEGDMFGETYACMGLKWVEVSIEALCDTQVLAIDVERIVASCPNTCTFHRQLNMNLLKILSGKNLQLNQKLFYLSHKTIRSRILAYLYDEANKHKSKSFEIPFNRNELSEYLCIDRSALSRELSNMKNEGLIDYNKNRFTLK